ncbi:site-specific tyrosine recombinase/integron integrase [Heliobacterium mobile]|nr:site-specific tyrosine recombinase/integron integrase [Heliobacterium mobile]
MTGIWGDAMTTTILEQYFSDHAVRFSPLTHVSYRNSLYQFFAFTPKSVDAVTAQDIREWMLELTRQGYTPKTLQKKLVTLRSFYRYCVTEGWTKRNPTQSIPLPKCTEKECYYLDREALDRLRQISEGRLRDRAIIETFYTTGVRLNELAHIQIHDIDFPKRQIRIWGKGKKERIVFFTRPCAELLKTYLSTRTDTLPYLFVSTRGSRIKSRSIGYLFQKYARLLGFPVSPHTLRHTFAAHLAERGTPLACIQDLLGHDDMENTRFYARLFAQARKEKYDQFS